jgi:hypothetical protein
MPSNKKKSEQTTTPVEASPVVVTPEPTKKSKSPKAVTDPQADVKTEDTKPKTSRSTKKIQGKTYYFGTGV